MALRRSSVLASPARAGRRSRGRSGSGSRPRRDRRRDRRAGEPYPRPDSHALRITIFDEPIRLIHGSTRVIDESRLNRAPRLCELLRFFPAQMASARTTPRAAAAPAARVPLPPAIWSTAEGGRIQDRSARAVPRSSAARMSSHTAIATRAATTTTASLICIWSSMVVTSSTAVSQG